MEVQLRLIDELQARMVFIVQVERASYYGVSGEGLFGPEVGVAFPSADYDIGESGKCYAVQRPTACVFHLMRVLEIGLSVFADKFGVPSDHTNWHNIIEGVEKAVRNMGSDPAKAPDWKLQQEFYSRRSHVDEAPQPRFLRAGELEVDLESRLLRKNGQEIHLSPREFELLALLMRHRGVPFTHSRLLRGVWGAEYGGELEYLRTYVKFLRKKIEADPAAPAYILTEPWVGYRFCDPADADSATARLAEN